MAFGEIMNFQPGENSKLRFFEIAFAHKPLTKELKWTHPLF